MLNTAMLAIFTGSLAMSPAAVTPPAPPAADLFNKSWDQMAKATRLKADCSVVAGTANMIAGLTADEQQDANLVAQALPKLSVKETDVFGIKEKKMSATREKSPSMAPFEAYKAGQIQYNDAVLYTSQTPKFLVQFMVNTTGLYYRGGATDPWKFIKSKDVAKSVLKSFEDMRLTDSFTKESFNFDSWESGKGKVAVYKGELTPAAANASITDAIGTALTVSSAPNEVRLHVNKATKNWDKMESLVTVDTGKINFPLIKTCTFTFGSAANFLAPTRVQNVSVEAGSKEFVDLVNNTK